MTKAIKDLIIFAILLTILNNSLIILHASSSQESQDHYIPGYVQVGDIIFMDAKNYFESSSSMSSMGWDHVAMYIGNNKWVESIGEKGVRITDFSENRWIGEYAYAYVKNANESIRLKAVEFAKKQLGESYDDLDFFKPCWNRLKNPCNDSDGWYCAELVWASYYNASNGEIDIDLNGWGRPRWVQTIDISSDDDVQFYPNWEGNWKNKWNPGMFARYLIQIITSKIKN